MAGDDKDYLGEVLPADGSKIGFWRQEPRLDDGKNVREHVEMAVGEVRALMKRFEELGEKMGQDPPPADFDAIMEEYGVLQDKIEACGGWELDRTVERAMDALRLPAGDADVSKLSGGERRRVALCQLLLSKPD